MVMVVCRIICVRAGGVCNDCVGLMGIIVCGQTGGCNWWVCSLDLTLRYQYIVCNISHSLVLLILLGFM